MWWRKNICHSFAEVMDRYTPSSTCDHKLPTFATLSNRKIQNRLNSSNYYPLLIRQNCFLIFNLPSRQDELQISRMSKILKPLYESQQLPKEESSTPLVFPKIKTSQVRFINKSSNTPTASTSTSLLTKVIFP